MIAYVDSSVLLRIILRQPNWLREAARIETAVSSKLVRVECHRALDRLWHSGQLTDDQLTITRRETEKVLDLLDLIEVNDDVLDLATEPAATPLATIDAVHLSTALFYSPGWPIHFATHDPVVANAARDLRFQVLGT